ncbi:hypothetical protein CH352_11850 [Leptospira hartskeerlii]|uniref:Uncharacterized protein n=1 Tax=Leptospira hartskeerlii TaxID=2023177 RepID=A0A2M9XB12_9LEPT|nr:hypothetical protein [Leptospira hartskeerlii]PJZ24887.1 hypothetical protein CH357_15030 [Leptospira hartskeerlii]PJZ33021.1 hypothetical protein CH352_11850 [Leptospira hartskeerlii]
MTKDDFKVDLLSLDEHYIVSKWVTERIPHIFNGNIEEYMKWKITLSHLLEIDSKEIIFTGSSCLGFSMNPNKNFKDFDQKSDVDIAIISHYHFDMSWFTLRHLGTKFYDLNYVEKASLDDHKNRLIYWGTIATDKILQLLPFSKQWMEAVSKLQNLMPIDGKEINFRIYNDFDSFKSYNINTIRKLKDIVLQGM